MHQIQVGVIGVGGMGARHVHNLTHEVAGARVVAIMDVDPDRLTAVGADVARVYAPPLVFDDAAALVAHPSVEAVIIASPDRFHAPLTHACLAAGKPVLCEKPLALTAAEAYTVVEAENALGRRLVQVGFMREYDPAHLAVKEVLDRGELGPRLAFRGVHTNVTSEKPRFYDDIFGNSVVHDLHSARWLMEDEIEEVYGSYVPRGGPGDTSGGTGLVLAQLRFRSGAIGHIECNVAAAYGYEVEVKITCQVGAVETPALPSPHIRHAGSRGQPVDPDWLVRFDTAYIAEARAWVNGLHTGQTTGPSAWDGYVSLLAADACTESARTGKPVRLNIPERPEIYRR